MEEPGGSGDKGGNDSDSSSGGSSRSSSRQSHQSIGDGKRSLDRVKSGGGGRKLGGMSLPGVSGVDSGSGNVRPSSRAPEYFLVSLAGRIESGDLYGINDIYCKYNFAYGSDWQITAGVEEGISQITSKDLDGNFVWNFPLEVTFKSSNPHGWPQLVLSLYGSDLLGNHIARGYGSTHIPISDGATTKVIPLFVPESSSFIQKLSSWIVGRRPEFVDPKLIAQGDGRQVVRVNSKGRVTVKFELIKKDFRKLGYVSAPSSHPREN